MKIYKVGTSAWRAEQQTGYLALNNGMKIQLNEYAVSYISPFDALRMCLDRFFKSNV